MIITQSNTMIPECDYVVMGDKTLVYIHKFAGMKTVTDDEQKETYEVYTFLTNEFSIPTGSISEDEIKSNIDYYLEYNTDSYSISDRISAIEEVLDYILMNEGV